MKRPDEIKKGLECCSVDGMHCGQGCPYMNNCHTEERFTSLEQDALALIQKLEAQVPRWISVEDRLPEDDLPKDSKRKMIRCLVETDKGTVKPCVRQRYDKKIDGKWQLCAWEWNKDLFAKPTHWMPMPEPPEK